jgi:hypothetical protein
MEIPSRKKTALSDGTSRRALSVGSGLPRLRPVSTLNVAGGRSADLAGLRRTEVRKAAGMTRLGESAFVLLNLGALSSDGRGTRYRPAGAGAYVSTIGARRPIHSRNRQRWRRRGGWTLMVSGWAARAHSQSARRVPRCDSGPVARWVEAPAARGRLRWWTGLENTRNRM